MSIHRSFRVRSSFFVNTICSLVFASLFCASSSLAEIYKWKDDRGRLHFAQDLSQVPPQHRQQAEAEARRKRPGPEIQHYQAAPAARSPRGRSLTKTSPSSASTVYRVKVSPSGSSMRVNVRLNDDVIAPFLIDTGATDVVIPESVARKLGVDLDSARTQYYRTANGTIESQVIVLESVDMGGARVEQVPASVSKTMSIGLLGLSYFNHFRYRVDPVAGVVTLEANGMVESGTIRGGRSEIQWRNEFRSLSARRQAIERAIDESDSKGARREERLQGLLDETARQIEVLDDEADEARVPMRWRD